MSNHDLAEQRRRRMAAAVTPRGSGGLSSIERIRQNYEAAAEPTIDWDMWRSMATVELVDALALSVGCSPDSMLSQYSAAQASEFAKRLRVAESHCGPGGTLPLVVVVAGDKQSRVRLPDFASWALALGWQLPELFPEPNGSPAGAKAVPASSEALATKPMQRRVLAGPIQDDNIIAKLVEHGHDPLRMPKAPRGKAPWPIRERVSNELNYSKDVMKKAWTRLRREGRIKDA